MVEFAEPLEIDSERAQRTEKTCFFFFFFLLFGCNTKANSKVAGKNTESTALYLK